MAALAATTGMAVAVLLWAEALETTLATTLTGIAVVAVIIGCGFVASRHERRHIEKLLLTTSSPEPAFGKAVPRGSMRRRRFQSSVRRSWMCRLRDH